jgi:DNA-binding transcriptional LysR family regulator
MELQLTDRLADLAGASVDIAVRMTDTPSPGLVARRLVEVPYTVCASPAYLARCGTPIHPRELAQHNCLYYVGAVMQTPWHFDGPDGHHAIEVRGSLTVNSIEVLRRVALGGLGIVAISRYHLSDEIARGAIVELLADYRLPERAVYLVTLPDRLLPAKTRAFIDFLWQRGAPDA